MARDGEKPTGQVIRMGEEFVAFLRAYEFIGRTGNADLSEKFLKVVESICCKCLPKDEDICRKNFVRLHGRKLLKKLFLFTLDTSEIMLTPELIEEDMEKLVSHFGILLLSCDIQRMLDEEGGNPFRVFMRIEENGVVKFWGGKDEH